MSQYPDADTPQGDPVEAPPVDAEQPEPPAEPVVESSNAPARAALAELDGLESEIAAVEQALESVDRITGDSGGRGGEAAAAALRAVVSAERFGD